MVLILKNLLFTILIPGTVAVYLPLTIAHGRSLSPQLVLLAIGTTLLIGGTLVYTWTVWDFASIGQGTPLPIDAPKKLVVGGLYQYVRNPMYSGVILCILGWSCLFSDIRILVYAAIVAIVVSIFVITYEEPRMTRQFGDEYIAYKSSVGRWLPRANRKIQSK